MSKKCLTAFTAAFLQKSEGANYMCHLVSGPMYFLVTIFPFSTFVASCRVHPEQVDNLSEG